MSQLSKLIQVTDEEKKMILKQYNMTEDELRECVNIFRDWINKNENFPDCTVSDQRIIVILLNSKMSLERAKKSYEGYLTMKKRYEDFFQKLVPDERFKRIETLSKNVIMPKLLPNLCRLTIAKVTVSVEEAEDGMDYYVVPLMIAELRMNNDFFLSNEILVDMKDYNLRTLLKFTPNVNIKLMNLWTSINLRVRQIHIVNAPPIWDKVFFLMRSVFTKNMLEKVRLHRSLEELHEHIPKEYLPSDYGGTEKSLDEIQEMWSRELEANEATFEELRKVKVKEILTQEKNAITDQDWGMDGSFKKLTID